MRELETLKKSKAAKVVSLSTAISSLTLSFPFNLWSYSTTKTALNMIHKNFASEQKEITFGYSSWNS